MVLLSLACTTTREISRPLSKADRAELVEATSNDRWTVRHEQEEVAHHPRLEGDGLTFTLTEGARREVPVAALRSVVVEVDHVHGAIDGTFLGILGGAAAGAAVGFSLGSDPPEAPGSDCGPCSFTASQKAFLVAIPGALAGAAVGLVVGAIIGHREVIEFAPAPAR